MVLIVVVVKDDEILWSMEGYLSTEKPSASAG